MTICICGHDIAKHSNQGCMAIIDVSEDKFCPCELTRMDVIKARAESAEARAVDLQARLDAMHSEYDAVKDEWHASLERAAQAEAELKELIEWRDAGAVEIEELTAERDEARAKLEQAVAAEREACAKVCDKNAREAAAECKRRYGISSDPDHDLIAMKFAAYDGQAQRDAAAIRARE